MATSKKFSALPAASAVGNGDLFAIAHEDALAETGYVSQKLTAAQAGQKVNGDTEYPTSLPSFPANGQNPFAALEKLNQDIIDLYPVNTASGSIANFTTSLEMPLVAMSAEIVAQQAGSGTPSPSNPRAISGFSSGVVSVCGVNIWDEVWELGYISVADGTNSYSQINIRSKNYIPIKPNISLYIKANNNFYCPIIFYDKDKNFLSSVAQIQWNRTITTPENAYYMRFYMHDSYGTTYHNDISINYPSTDTSYHAYNGETKTIALGQTVYGGSVDAKNGKLVVTHGVVDLGTLSWSATNNSMWVAVLNGMEAVATNKVPPFICEEYNAVSWTDGTGSTAIDNCFCVLPQYNQIRVRNLACTTQAEFEEAINGVHLCYGLATPIEITGLTPANFTTFAGEQNIFSDCGDISVSFKQGIQEYIDAKIAETQALIL